MCSGRIEESTRASYLGDRGVLLLAHLLQLRPLRLLLLAEALLLLLGELDLARAHHVRIVLLVVALLLDGVRVVLLVIGLVRVLEGVVHAFNLDFVIFVSSALAHRARSHAAAARSHVWRERARFPFQEDSDCTDTSAERRRTEIRRVPVSQFV